MAAPTPKPPVAYVEEPGVIEFSGQIIVKPITKAEADAQGLTEEEYQLARANAISAIYAEATTDNDVHYIEALDHYVITVPSGKTETSLSNQFLGSGNFSFSEPNWICSIICTNDPSVADNTQWHHTRIDSCDAWTIETGSPSVVVAIVDTGIDTAHPDLQLHRQEAWDMRYPFASPPPIRRESLGAVVTDNNSHGTHCLGIAAANGNNGIGISGVGQSLGHRSLKVNDGNSSGSANYVTINEAIRKAADLGDKVISVSWNFGGNSYSSRVDAATYAKERGSLVFNAAGNSSTYLSFANYGNRDLLLVGSIENTGDQRSNFSSYGEGVFIWAPGSAIYSTIPSSTYGYKSGTSMACPMVAGLAALIWSRNPNLSTTQVKEILLNSADNITITGADSNSYNVKRINSYSAMLATPLPDSTDSTDSTDIPDYTDSTNIPDYTDSTNIPDNTDVMDPDLTDSTDGEQRNPVILIVGSLSKINVYPVVYAKDTNGNILKDTNGNKIILKNYQDVLITDEYTIVTEITSG